MHAPPPCSKTGQLHSILEGSSVQWPAGIRMMQCEQAFGGQWLLGVGHWDGVSPQELSRVKAIRAKHRAA